MNRTQSDRTRRLRESNSKKGLAQVTVWVPLEKLIDIKALAEKWRQEKAVQVKQLPRREESHQS